VYAIPSLPDGKAWTFWQYSDRQRSEGTNGKEKRIDMNVFRAGPEEFAAYATDLTP
jgi:lysozyme